VKPGEAFLFAKAGLPAHLHFVISNACGEEEDEVVVVSLTSVRNPKHVDKSCVVTKGEHAFIIHDSYVLYQDARVIKAAFARGLNQHDIASAALLGRILAGAASSKFLPRKIRTILELQGLIAEIKPQAILPATTAITSRAADGKT